MNRKNIIISLVLFLTLCIISVVSYAFIFESEQKDEKEQISVIVYGNNADRWSALKIGVEQAGTDLGNDVTFITMSNDEDAEEQQNLIEREVRNGADGILLACVDSSKMKEVLEDVSYKIPVVMIETNLDENQDNSRYSYVSGNNYEMGKTLAKEVLNQCKNNERIAVVKDKLQRESVEERLNGFTNYFVNNGEEVILWEKETSDYNQTFFIKSRICRSKPDVVVALDAVTLESVIDIIGNMDMKIDIYGIGNTDKIVYNVDKGTVNTIVCQNEFKLGYVGVQAVNNQLAGSMKKEQMEIEYSVINKSNIYSPDNQKLLFPNIQ